MKIVIINAVYPPEPVVSAQIGSDLARQLVDVEHKVTVLCPSPTRPAVADYSELKAHGKPLVRVEDGAEVVRLPSYTSPQFNLFSRMHESFGFGWHACRYLKSHVANVDVVYVNSWPIFCQALIARYCSKNRIPMVLHIQDIYPESLINKLPKVLRVGVGSLLTRLDRWIASKAAHVITISENMHQTYVEGRGISADRVTKVLNWVDEVPFEEMPERVNACAHYEVDESKFTFLYLGNIGPVAGVELLIDAFHEAKLENAQLVVAGDGSAKVSCLERVQRLGAENVHFISDPDVNNTPLIQSLAHVCLLPMKKGAGMSSIPSKLMAYLFSAKPVLASVDVDSDTAFCIKEAQCGWVGEPEQVQWLAGKMEEVAGMPSGELHEMGARGRRYTLANFSKTQGVQRVGKIVINAATGVCCC